MVWVVRSSQYLRFYGAIACSVSFTGFQAVQHDAASVFFMFRLDHVIDKEGDGEDDEDEASDDDDVVDALCRGVLWLWTELNNQWKDQIVGRIRTL